MIAEGQTLLYQLPYLPILRPRIFINMRVDTRVSPLFSLSSMGTQWLELVSKRVRSTVVGGAVSGWGAVEASNEDEDEDEERPITVDIVAGGESDAAVDDQVGGDRAPHPPRPAEATAAAAAAAAAKGGKVEAELRLRLLAVMTERSKARARAKAKGEAS